MRRASSTQEVLLVSFSTGWPCERKKMKTLNNLQRRGLSILFVGFASFLLFALLLPSWRGVWLVCWGLAVVGCGIYVVGTIPSIREWLHKMWNSKTQE
jgi:hypothetical protein